MRLRARALFPMRVLILLALIAVPASVPAQELDATALTAPVDLATGWRVHAGDNPAFASPAFDDSHWPAFDAHDSLIKILPNRPSIVWFRLRVKALPGQQGLGLRAWNLSNAFEIYVNGRRVIKSGSVAPFKSYTYDARLLVPITSSDTASGSLLIAARVYVTRFAWDDPGAGLYYQNLTLGQYTALDQADWLAVIGDNAIQWLNTFGWVAMGIVALALFVAQRRRREYLWMFLSAIMMILPRSIAIARYFHTVPAGWELVSQTISVAGLVFNLLMFFTIAGIRFNWWIRGLVAMAGFGIVISWLGSSQGALSGLASILVQAPVVVLMAIVLPFLLLLRYRRGNREAGILLIAAVIQSLWFYIAYTTAFLEFVPATRSAAASFALTWFYLHVGPLLMDWGALTSLLYALCLSIIIVLRSTRVSRQQALVESELEAARQVQQVILPQAIETFPGFRVETVYHPAQQVGGDFFQVIPTGSGDVLMVIGDVAGKGLPAAMLVSVLVGAIRGVAAYTSDPAELLANLNERMVGRSGGGFSTALAALIGPGGQVSIANAGHPSPYLDGAELELPGALPLGVKSGVRYSTLDFRLQPGSRLTFISDGVVEAQNQKGELFGFDRSRELSRKPAAEIADAARRFGQQDDITVVAIERTPVPEPSPVPVRGLNIAPAQS